MGKMGQIRRTPKWLRSRSEMPLPVEQLSTADISLRYLRHFDASAFLFMSSRPNRVSRPNAPVRRRSSLRRVFPTFPRRRLAVCARPKQRGGHWKSAAIGPPSQLTLHPGEAGVRPICMCRAVPGTSLLANWRLKCRSVQASKYKLDRRLGENIWGRPQITCQQA
jgi:hypothetical protein